MITTLDGYSGLLYVRLLKSKTATVVAKAIHDIIATDFLYTQRVIMDDLNRPEAQRRAAQYYTQLTHQIFIYNTCVHRSTGFAPVTLHTGQMMLSPGLLPPDNTLPLPPVAAGLNHKSFVTELNQFQELACGVVDINRTEAQQRATQYYTQLTFQIKEESWVIVHRGFSTFFLSQFFQSRPPPDRVRTVTGQRQAA